MCGIAGFSRFHKSTGDINTLLKMGDRIAHRGPDAHGEYIDDYIGLCHRRLSIIDLSDAGTQPMVSDDGNLILVFNGEIYNFLELRAELEEQGFYFKSKTDSEVILQLYKRDGENCVNALYGMFAFAIWDKRQRKLFLARDRLGKKPLYFYEDGGRFIFASEIKSILEVEGVEKKIRDDAVYDFFAYQYIPESKSIFHNIHKLNPGHFMVVTDKGHKISKYWELSFDSPLSGDATEISEGLYDVISNCTKQRMISDVPLGAFLSGGVDSSGIVAMMSQYSHSPVTTCAIGFDSKKYDEVEYARVIAEKYNTNHFELTVKDNLLDHLDEITKYFDEPFADQSLVPTYYVSRLARQKVTVALSGDGGDENFAGYSKYSVDESENNLRKIIPSIFSKCVFPFFRNHFEHSEHRTLNRAATLMRALQSSPGMGFYLTNSFITDNLWNDLIQDKFRSNLDGYHPAQQTIGFYDQADSDDHLAKILFTDIKTFLVGDILVKVDRMSMANSLEVRAPLLDHRVVEYAAKIPSSLKLHGKDKKHILKKTFTKLLPHDILYRKKMGFSVPLSHWLKNDLKPVFETLLLNQNSGASNYFNVTFIKNIWYEHQSNKKDHSTILWSLLMFEFWWQHYISN